MTHYDVVAAAATVAVVQTDRLDDGRTEGKKRSSSFSPFVRALNGVIILWPSFRSSFATPPLL